MSADPLRTDRFRTRSTRVRGFEQVFVDEGSGPALLLVHGWPETRRIWWRNVEPLAAAGFRVIVPDLRGFGESEPGGDGFGDVPAHSRDLHALVTEELGLSQVIPVGGDLGGAVIQDFSARFPECVERMVVFNSPLPYLKDEMQGMNTRPAAEAADYFLRQGSDADALAAELDSPEQRRRYIASFYTSRFWAHPGTFTREEVDFQTEPFADGAQLRASFRTYESAMKPELRSELPQLAIGAARVFSDTGRSLGQPGCAIEPRKGHRRGPERDSRSERDRASSLGGHGAARGEPLGGFAVDRRGRTMV